MGLQETEAECANVGEPGSQRVTLQSMEDKIKHKVFISGRDVFEVAGYAETDLTEDEDAQAKVMTICMCVTENGFTLIGKSAPADVKRFDAELGKKLAYEDCIRQMWPLEGYMLREKLYGDAQAKLQEEK